MMKKSELNKTQDESNLILFCFREENTKDDFKLIEERLNRDNSSQYLNVSNVVPYTAAAHSGTKVVRMNQSNAAGPSYSKAVFAGDQVAMEVWSYYESTSGYGTTNNTTANLVPLIAGAFGGVSGGTGDAGLKYAGVNSALTNYGLGANPGDAQPSAFLNYILFDKNYKVMDMGWQRVPAGSFTKQYVNIPTITVKEAGYIFVYLSYEDVSNNYVYFDDFKVTVTPTNIIQSNEYYPFGLQTATSWTRDNNVANNFLGNGGTELNTTSQLYDLDFRNYDPILGRLHQVDPMAEKYHSLSTYHFSFNNPTGFTDPSGATPVEVEGNTIIINWDEFGTHGGSYSDSWGYRGYETEEQAYYAGRDYQAANAQSTQTAMLAMVRSIGNHVASQYAQTGMNVTSLIRPMALAEMGASLDDEWRQSTRDPSAMFYFIKSEREAYLFMRAIQDLTDGKGNILGKETVGVLSINQKTKERGVLILPWAGNSYDNSNATSGFYETFFEDSNGDRYTPLAIIHTHPENDIGTPTWGNSRMGDLSTAKMFGNLPLYILGSQNFIQFYPTPGYPGNTYDLIKTDNPLSLFPKN